MKRLLWLALLLSPAAAAAAVNDPARPWEAYIKSPSSRDVPPQRVHAVSGDARVTNAPDGTYVLSLQPGGQVSLDFGYVGGLLSMTTQRTAVNTTTTDEDDDGPHFSLAFAESPSFVRAISDDTGAVYTQDYDKALNVTLTDAPGNNSSYTMPAERFRGGFKFLTIHAFAPVRISSIVCHLGYSPSQPDPGVYAGHFYTPDDDLLVRAWYAGVFTAQTNIAPPNTSRWLPQVRDGWAYNATLGVEGPMLLDGAKRDRAVWPGDLGIAGTTAYLGLGDVGLESVYYALETMFLYQNASTGALPFAGPTTGSWRRGARSDTYHAWTLIACFNYALFTTDAAWLDARWDRIAAGVGYILRALAASGDVGLAEQVETNDWARLGGGGFNSALNALNYHALASLSSLAADTGRASEAGTWSAAAARLKTAYNAVLWDPAASLYRDNETAAGALLHPQDGNALALYYNLTRSPEQASAVSASLLGNWNEIGPVTPELPDTISPFISSVEVLAHYAASRPRRALRLMRRTWGHMLDSPEMTGATLVEGMSANGSLYYRSRRGYNYDAAYTSLSHSWSTGPTQALSFKAVGLEVVGWKRWVFRPALGDLKSARAGWTGGGGGFGAVVEIDGDVIEAEIWTPDGTSGRVEMACEVVLVDGEVVDGVEVEGGKMKIRGENCNFGC